MCADQKHNGQDSNEVEYTLSRLFLTAELPMKIQNACITLQSAIAMHNYLDIRTLTISTE